MKSNRLIDWICSIGRDPLYLYGGEVSPHQESNSIQIPHQNTTPNPDCTVWIGLTGLSDRSDPVSSLPEAITLSSELQIGRSTYAFRLSRRELCNGEVQFAFWQSNLDRSDRFVHTGLIGLYSLSISVVSICPSIFW